MRVSRHLLFGSIAACLIVANGPLVFAGGKKAAPKKTLTAAVPAAPTGVARTPDAVDAYYGGAKTDTIKEYRNELGQTVYAVSASHFDVSAPLSEMAANAGPEGTVEVEAPLNPEPPGWFTRRSDVTDPVVQAGIAPDNSFSGGGFPPAAPSIGFTFEGVPSNGATPSDSNGSVGNNQFVETVNTRYEVWSLTRATHSAAVQVPATNINTLWTTFGGPCAAQNSGDPVVLFDKVASRWLISQLTTTASGGLYYQCVAVSTTANAAGTYARWAFAVPGGLFPDYPKFGVWTDAYYMTAHGFTSASGTFSAGLFAAMDRTKMLAGDPTATWQVIQDPGEFAFMVADLDGFAPPPTKAPGVFMSMHFGANSTDMWIYRMKVDFVTPANTVRTTQAKVTVAPANGACFGTGSSSCIPQPSSTVKLASFGGYTMFRVAYRNFIDHESLVASVSVDPSVTGVVSGVRWLDFRLSGAPDATCPSYPCIYQQGTFADVANGRSRWLPSIAMDTAEDILLGYSTTGKTAGTDNHSIRYTGRAKSDPPGTMTAPETIIHTGTANVPINRWGDYSSMSVDPFDDCTFWYVGQFYTSTTLWRTWIASSVFPAGSGAGQCPATTCSARPASAPTIGVATVPGDNQITLSWTGIAPTPGSYAIERADGVCGSEGPYRPLAATVGAPTSFTDTTVLGGLGYSYRVIAAADAAGKCQALVVSGCASATATGTCNLRPVFGGASNGTSNQSGNCGVTLNWTQAASSCPLTPNLRYNIFRGTVPDFVPSLANRIATCIVGPSSYVDTTNLASGATYYYVVRAEDSSTGNGGECGGGNEDTNVVAVPGTAYGVGTQASPGTWTDGGGDGSSFMLLNVGSPGDTNDQVWRYVKTTNDAGANHTPGGAYAYRNAGPAANNVYFPDVCAEMQAPPLTAAASNVNLEFWERHQVEYHWDAIAVEYSRNGGAWTDVPAPSNSAAAGCDVADDTTGWETMECTTSPPVNACGYPATKVAYNGPLASGTTCNDYATSSTVTSYAHRCHPITGLTPGDTIQFRWRFASDPGAEYAGFYLDDVAVTNVRMPNVCVPDTCAGQPNGTACNAGVACTSGDTCVGGTCSAGAPAPPPSEVAGVSVDGHSSTTLTWTGLGGGVVYDVASSTLSDLRTNGTATATCLANDVPVASYTDGRADPAAGDGYYYLVRGQSVCASGTYGFNSASVERTPTAACP